MPIGHSEVFDAVGPLPRFHDLPEKHQGAEDPPDGARVLMSVGNPRVPDPLGVQHQVVLVMRDDDPTGGPGQRRYGRCRPRLGGPPRAVVVTSIPQRRRPAASAVKLSSPDRETGLGEKKPASGGRELVFRTWERTGAQRGGRRVGALAAGESAGLGRRASVEPSPVCGGRTDHRGAGAAVTARGMLVAAGIARYYCIRKNIAAPRHLSRRSASMADEIDPLAARLGLIVDFPRDATGRLPEVWSERFTGASSSSR